MGCGGSIGSIVGGVGGFLAGGPVGGLLGASLGGTAGGMLDGKPKNPYENQQNQVVQSQNQAAQAQIKMAQDQIDRWNKLYGPIENNLANFYAKANPSQIASLGLQRIQTEFQKATEKNRLMLAQKGLSGTSTEANINAMQNINLAEAKANERIQAPVRLREEQQGFLASGRGAQNTAFGMQQSAFGAQRSALGTQLGNLNSQAQTQMMLEQQQSQGLGNLLGAGLQLYGQAQGMNRMTSLPSLGIGGNFTPIGVS